jgi:hypothetical protein
MTHEMVDVFLAGLIKLHQTSWSSVSFLLQPATREATGQKAGGANLMIAVRGAYGDAFCVKGATTRVRSSVS